MHFFLSLQCCEPSRLCVNVLTHFGPHANVKVCRAVQRDCGITGTGCSRSARPAPVLLRRCWCREPGRFKSVVRPIRWRLWCLTDSGTRSLSADYSFASANWCCTRSWKSSCSVIPERMILRSGNISADVPKETNVQSNLHRRSYTRASPTAEPRTVRINVSSSRELDFHGSSITLSCARCS